MTTTQQSSQPEAMALGDIILDSYGNTAVVTGLSPEGQVRGIRQLWGSDTNCSSYAPRSIQRAQAEQAEHARQRQAEVAPDAPMRLRMNDCNEGDRLLCRDGSEALITRIGHTSSASIASKCFVVTDHGEHSVHEAKLVTVLPGPMTLGILRNRRSDRLSRKDA